MASRILALSSSRLGNGGYLQNAIPVLTTFLGLKPLTICFIPFASADDYDAYGDKVATALQQLPYTLTVAQENNAKELLEQSHCVMVGGGNTFKLLHHLYKYDLLNNIKNKISNNIPYVGWSAGANITGLTIGTTNDMPIIQPPRFTALELFPFQINPHYYNQITEGFNGETRDQRLEEFLKLNPDKTIVCLPEGTALEKNGSTLTYTGVSQGVVMRREEGKTIHLIITPETDLSHLLK